MPTKGPVGNIALSCCSKRHLFKGTVSKRKHCTSCLFSCWWVSKDSLMCKWATSHRCCWKCMNWADTINMHISIFFLHAKTWGRCMDTNYCDDMLFVKTSSVHYNTEGSKVINQSLTPQQSETDRYKNKHILPVTYSISGAKSSLNAKNAHVWSAWLHFILNHTGVGFMVWWCCIWNSSVLVVHVSSAVVKLYMWLQQCAIKYIIYRQDGFVYCWKPQSCFSCGDNTGSALCKMLTIPPCAWMFSLEKIQKQIIKSTDKRIKASWKYKEASKIWRPILLKRTTLWFFWTAWQTSCRVQISSSRPRGDVPHIFIFTRIKMHLEDCIVLPSSLHRMFATA